MLAVLRLDSDLPRASNSKVGKLVAKSVADSLRLVSLLRKPALEYVARVASEHDALQQAPRVPEDTGPMELLMLCSALGAAAATLQTASRSFSSSTEPQQVPQVTRPVPGPSFLQRLSAEVLASRLVDSAGHRF